jgi:hypothetical protein
LPVPELTPVTSAFCPFNHSGSGCDDGNTGAGHAVEDSTIDAIVLYLLCRTAGSRWNAWLQQLCDQSRPARLMGRAEPTTGIAMEVLVEMNVIAEVWVVLDARSIARQRAAAVRITQKQTADAPSELAGHLMDREMPTGSRRALDEELVAVVMVKLLERFDDQKIERQPDRTPPV